MSFGLSDLALDLPTLPVAFFTVDNTFFRGKYEGCLLIAYATDGDNGTILIAYAVVEAEINLYGHSFWLSSAVIFVMNSLR